MSIDICKFESQSFEALDHRGVFMTIALCYFQLRVRDGTCQTHILCLSVAGKLPWSKRSGSVDKQLSEHVHKTAVCPGDQEGQWYSGLCRKYCGQEGEGSDCSSVASTAEVTYEYEYYMNTIFRFGSLTPKKTLRC